MEKYTSLGETDGDWIKVRGESGNWTIENGYMRSNTAIGWLHKSNRDILGKLLVPQLVYTPSLSYYGDPPFSVSSPVEVYTKDTSGNEYLTDYRKVYLSSGGGEDAPYLRSANFDNYPYVYSYSRNAWLYAMPFDGVIWFVDIETNYWFAME